MPDNTAALRHADYLIWAIIAAVALIVTAAGTVGPFHVDLPSYLRAATACALMMAIAGFYSLFRRDPKLASALTGTAQLAAFAATRLRIFILGFMLATVVTIAISALMPAQGVWGQLHLTANDYPNIEPATQSLHLAVFHGLRDGSFRTLMGLGSEGIITFPSLHAALGLLFMLAMWPLPYLRWVMIALNVLMIAATPVDGGHYFSDVIAGLAIAALCWLATRRCVDRRHLATSGEISAADAPSIIPDADMTGVVRAKPCHNRIRDSRSRQRDPLKINCWHDLPRNRGAVTVSDYFFPSACSRTGDAPKSRGLRHIGANHIVA